MLGPGVHVHLVLSAARLQRRLVGRPQRVDALVALGVLDQQRRLDVRHSRRLRRRSVERDGRFQIRAERDRQEVGRAAAPAEADDSQLAGGQRMRLQEARAVDHVRAQLALVEAGLQRAAVVVVARISAHRREPVGGERQKSFGRGSASHVLDVRVEAAILMDHEDGGERPRRIRLDEIPAHRARGAARRGVGHVPSLDPRIGEGDRLGLRVAGQQRLSHCERRHAADRQGAGALQELAPVDAAVTVLVVELEHAPVELELGQGQRVRRGCRPVRGALFGHRSRPPLESGFSPRLTRCSSSFRIRSDRRSARAAAADLSSGSCRRRRRGGRWWSRAGFSWSAARSRAPPPAPRARPG